MCCKTLTQGTMIKGHHFQFNGLCIHFILFSEIGAGEKGFTVELWKKGLLWDSMLGVLWIPLSSVEHATDVS